MVKRKKISEREDIFLSLTVYIYLETKKSPSLSEIFFVLTISLSFLEFEWKILYRLKANILNFFTMWKFFLYFEDFLSYHFWYKSHTFCWQIQKYHFSHSDQKNFSFVKTPTSIDYFAINISKINAFYKNDMIIWIVPCFWQYSSFYFPFKKILRKLKEYLVSYNDQCSA